MGKGISALGDNVHQCFLFAKDIILVVETRDAIISKVERWSEPFVMGLELAERKQSISLLL